MAAAAIRPDYLSPSTGKGIGVEDVWALGDQLGLREPIFSTSLKEHCAPAVESDLLAVTVICGGSPPLGGCRDSWFIRFRELR